MAVQALSLKKEKVKVPLLKRRSVIIAIMAVILGVAFLGIPAVVHAADPSGATTLEGDPTAPVPMFFQMNYGSSILSRRILDCVRERFLWTIRA